LAVIITIIAIIITVTGIDMSGGMMDTAIGIAIGFTITGIMTDGITAIGIGIIMGGTITGTAIPTGNRLATGSEEGEEVGEFVLGELLV
jgi:hypothetical protein